MVLGLFAAIAAAEPNYVETTSYDVDGNGNNVVATEYSDGMGRTIQTKLKLAPDTSSSSPVSRDRVSCLYYDSAGRLSVATKSFVDNIYGGQYLPGTLTDPNVKSQLEASNGYDTRAYSTTEYWNDPYSRVKRTLGPGDSLDYGWARSWTLGVGLDTLFPYYVFYGETPVATIDIAGGIITAININNAAMPKLEDVFDTIYTHFLRENPFTKPQWVLTISMTPRSEDPYWQVSEELRDISGRTIRTFSDPDVVTTEHPDGIVGAKILAEYEFDILGNTLSEYPPLEYRGKKLIDATEYRYNTLGQLVYKKTPDGGEFEYVYREDGAIECYISFTTEGTTKRTVRKIGYEYDSLGRVTRIYRVTKGGFSQEGLVYNFYDEITGMMSSRAVFASIPGHYYKRLTNLKGRLAGRIASNYVDGRHINVGEIFSYDDEGRVNRKYTLIAGSPAIQENVYEYDVHGKVTVEYFYYGGDRTRKRYQYDYLGRLEKVFNAQVRTDGSVYNEVELTASEYDDVGKLRNKRFSAISSPEPYNVYYSYDIRDRLKSAAVPPDRPGFGETINYAKSGNISDNACTYIFDPSDLSTIHSVVSDYVYDGVNRLAAATMSGDSADVLCSYSYDNAGRFRSKQEGPSSLAGYEYYADTLGGVKRYTNRLKHTDKNPLSHNDYVYDKHGNMVADIMKKMVVEYDWRDMPIAYRFYDTLSSVITYDSAGTYTNSDLYAEIKADTSIHLLSTVIMLYDADGNRILKMVSK